MSVVGYEVDLVDRWPVFFAVAHLQEEALSELDGFGVGTWVFRGLGEQL